MDKKWRVLPQATRYPERRLATFQERDSPSIKSVEQTDDLIR